MFGFGSKRQDPSAPGEGGSLDTLATTLVERLLQTGFDGKGKFDSARSVAQSALHQHGGDPDAAIEDVISSHRKLAAAEGFVTSLGGVFTMPVAIPANVVGFYLLATRMTATIAAIRGHDIDSPEVRSAVLLSLLGTDATEVLAKVGVPKTGVVTGMATRQLPPAALMMVNKAVGFRLVSRAGAKVLTRLGKAIPIAGGIIGAGLDVVLLNRIARHAEKDFPPAQRQLHA